MFSLIFYGIYIVLLYRLLAKAFVFEPVSRLEQRILPAYALIMFLVTMNWTWANILLLLVLALLSFGLAWLQVQHVQVQETDKLDKRGRPVIRIRKGLTYLLGWVGLIALAILLPLFLKAEGLTGGQLLHEIINETKKDIFIFSFISQKSEWYIWALTTVNSSAFTYLLIRKNPRIKEALTKGNK